MGKSLESFDWLTLIVALILAGFSLAILSTSSGNFFSSQVVFFLLGFALFFFFAKVDFFIYKSLLPLIYLVLIFLLLLIFFGPQVRGASRWLEIFGVRWQPSELVKPFLVLILAGFFSSRSSKDFRSIFMSLLILLPPLLLIFLQPDLGNTLIILSIGLGIIYGAGLPLHFGVVGLLASLLVLPFTWLILKDYQKARLISFINPLLDPQGAGYHSLQAMIAVGSGQLTGLGLGRGYQSHLLFLPEHQTDFIFAALSEEFGLIGAGVVLAAYAVLLFHLLQVMKKNNDRFAALILTGIFTQLFFQIVINTGMNLGLVPITGVTLPLVSYGGSSVVSTMISLGIFANIAKKTDQSNSLDLLPS